MDNYRQIKTQTPLNTVRENFSILQNNFSIIESIHFMEYFRHLPKETMLENWSCLYELNTASSVSFLNQLIKTSDWDDDKLLECKEEISSFKETLGIIDSVIENNNSLEQLRDDVMGYLFESRFKSYCLYESYLDNELEVIMYNINYSPETISELELLIRKIKLSNITQVIGSFPKLLDRSTEMIRFINITLKGDVLDLVTSIPTVIANKLVDNNINKSQVRTYIKTINRQIGIMSRTLKTEGRPELYNMYSAYMKSLVTAKELLDTYASNSVIENIAEMQPDIVLYDESVIDDLTGDLEEMLASFIFDPEDEINLESFDKFVRLAKTYNCLYERANVTIRAANKVGNVNRKIGAKAVSASKDATRVKTAIKKSIDPLVNLISNTVNKIKEADKKSRTEAIITGGMRGKLASLLRKVILSLGAFAAGTAIKAGVFGTGTTLIGIKAAGAFAGLTNPALVVISILVAVAIDKAIDKKYRKTILNDLETELRLVTEKIEDARGEGNKEAKYELMRIQNKLTKDIERIKYGLK